MKMNSLREEFKKVQVTSYQQSSKYGFLWVMWAIFFMYIGPKCEYGFFLLDIMGSVAGL